MKRLSIILTLVLTVFTTLSIAREQEKKTVDANVYHIDSDGGKHFVCPVMGGKGVVSEKTTFTVVDGKKYYHCCPGCKDTDKVKKALKAGFAVPANIVKVEKGKEYFVCPIMKNQGVVSRKTHFSDYKGKRYYFCCKPCKPKFDKNPEKHSKL